MTKEINNANSILRKTHSSYRQCDFEDFIQNHSKLTKEEKGLAFWLAAGGEISEFAETKTWDLALVKYNQILVNLRQKLAKDPTLCLTQ